ncbi:MAG: hypothetical protein D6685_12290 [Bacteroidetes bacterium]|nr:MAG: hypothetical protein D6685_12290 [Bacteroidota bacterium]
MTSSRPGEPRRDTDTSSGRATSEPKDAPAPPTVPGAYWDYCPNCSARLYNVGCKYRCPRCHYFMSCSDFD